MIQRRDLIVLIAVLAVAAAGIAVFGQARTGVLGIAAAVIGISILWNRLSWGLYAIAALYPFTYFEFVRGSVNVPYIDLIAMTVAFVWGLRLLYGLWKGTERVESRWFPALVPMALFVASAALSITNVESEAVGLGVKYIARPIVFFYLMYVVVPQALIASEVLLTRVLRVIYGVGIFVSLIGAWSLLFPPVQGIVRAIPVPVFGIDLLGPNHNLIAEVLVMTIPVGLCLMLLSKRPVARNWLLIGTVFQLLIALLTLSRAGWLSIGVEALLMFVLLYRTQLKSILQSGGTYAAALLLLPLVALMIQLLTSGVSLSANLNRLKLIDIAIDLFREHPIAGAGVGTFTAIVSQIKWYTIEYGGALDAHGMFFKILAEQGVLGVAAWTLVVGAVLTILYRAYLLTRGTRWGIITAAGFILAVGGFTFQTFGTAYYLSKLWLPIGVALAAAQLAKSSFKTHGYRSA